MVSYGTTSDIYNALIIVGHEFPQKTICQGLSELSFETKIRICGTVIEIENVGCLEHHLWFQLITLSGYLW